MKSLWKSALLRGVNSFSYSMAFTILFYSIFMLLSPDTLPLLPEYLEHFESPVFAMLVQILLIGCMSTVFGVGSVIMELEKLPLLAQSILYFILTTSVWLPIANFCWHFTDYPQALLGILGSYLLSYIISWTVQYRICRKNIEDINRKLEQLKNEENI